MRKILLAVSLATVSSFAFAADSGLRLPGTTARTSGGVAIKGTTKISASAQGTTTTAEGASVAKTAIGTIKSGTSIVGNTTINSTAKNTTTTAKGKSTAVSTIGGIGGE
ncbi:hypothetical protein TI05_09920 [Achromatium sp. WMS3]|nr:hypothetical protein TI05_09920 [Achromatium sp. WMS3]